MKSKINLIFRHPLPSLYPDTIDLYVPFTAGLQNVRALHRQSWQNSALQRCCFFWPCTVTGALNRSVWGTHLNGPVLVHALTYCFQRRQPTPSMRFLPLLKFALMAMRIRICPVPFHPHQTGDPPDSLSGTDVAQYSRAHFLVTADIPGSRKSAVSPGCAVIACCAGQQGLQHWRANTTQTTFFSAFFQSCCAGTAAHAGDDDTARYRNGLVKGCGSFSDNTL